VVACPAAVSALARTLGSPCRPCSACANAVQSAAFVLTVCVCVYTHTPTPTPAHTHARTHAHTHTHTHVARQNMDQNDTVEKIKSCCLKHIEAVRAPSIVVYCAPLFFFFVVASNT
jgi:hypothetical protein